MSEDVSLKLTAMQQKLDSADNSTVVFGIVDKTPVGGFVDGGFRPTKPIYGDLTSNFALPQYFKKDLKLFSAVFNADLGAIDFISATTYSKQTTRQQQDASSSYAFAIPLLTNPSQAGYAPFDLALDMERFTQEFRIASPQGERFEWLLGVYYSDEKVNNQQTLDGLDLNGNLIPGLDDFVVALVPSDYKEIAAFANATLKVTDKFDITAGVRFAHNKQGFHQITYGIEAIIGPASNTPGASKESVFTYAVSPQYHFNEDVMAYARVATGYRPGGPNVSLPGVPSQIDADRTTNYELGLKAEFFGRKVLFDLAVFKIDWDKIQLTSTNGQVSFGINGGTATSQGFELSTAYQPVRDLRLGFNLAYTDAHLTAPVDTGFAGIWQSGDDLPGAPRWTASWTFDYKHPLTDDWNADFSAGVRYVGKSFSAPNHDRFMIPLEAYTALDAAIGVSNPRYRLQFYAKNLTDERAYGANTVGVDIGDNPLYAYSTPIQPRTLGVSLDVTF
jgi:iron complex outermembrane receptor protein